ncbi:MAG: oligoendopeptidase pepF/M3 family [Deltaproteobacteria bacterium]|nr:oligoendopeptidase pepF/M3 family [Deltaproteobacteria bacterium]
MVGAMTEAAPATTPDTTSQRGPAAGVTWDLGDLYAGPDDPRIEADLARALAAAQRFAERYRTRVAELDAAALVAAIDELEAFEEPAYRAAAFAQLLFASDTSAPRHGALLQRVQERGTEIRNAVVFFELEWVAIDDARAAALFAAPVLARRLHLLEQMRKIRPHVLSEAEERLLEETANTGPRAFSRLFDETLGSLRFQLEVADGKTEEKSEEEVLSLLYEPDRALRRRAADSLTRGLRENSRLLAFVFNTLVQDKATRDRLRHYASPIDERNLANEIDDTTVQALMTACERRGALVARYYRLKARLLGLPELEDYDRYAPVLAADGARSFDAARALVLEAYGDFSPRMAEIAGHFFERRWIDAELRNGKRGGAFSASTIPSSHPYVMLNYTGTLRDVMTLAHELGHGVHQVLSRARGLFEMDAPLTTAETASVFGEMLTFRRLLRDEPDPAVRLGLLCGKLEDAFATVFRQVVMTRFEEKLHRARRAEGELPIPRVNELWMEANRPMFGDAVRLRDDYAWWWLYIPHFVHSPFYCYAYAFGELLVLALVQRYDEEGAAFVPRYLAMLEAGGSQSPREVVAHTGLDIGDPDFWERGLALLEKMVAEAESLAMHCGRLSQ